MSSFARRSAAVLCSVILFFGAVTSHLSAQSSDDVVLYDFRSDKCPPCRAMDPIVHKLKDQGYPIRIVNVQEDSEMAEQFNVAALPCFLVAANGKEVARIEGATSESKLQDLIRLGTAAASQRTAPATKPSRQSYQDQFVYPSQSFNRELPTSSSRGNNPASHSIQMVAGANATERPQLGSGSHGQLVELEQSGRTGFVPNPSPNNRSSQLNSSSGREFNNVSSNNSWPQRGDLMESSVRLILSDANSRSFGSGTIIDCRQGEALIVTCGHIFRDWSERSRITVDMFGPNVEQQVPGRVLMHDLKSDVAIIAIQVQRPVRAAHVAKEGTKIQRGEPALAIGCEHGQDVATYSTKVMEIDKYLGPSNLQIEGRPQQGRSGGGLFNRNGDLIGICNGAFQDENIGLYAGLTAVHQLLDKAQLEFVYRTNSAPPKFDRELERITSRETPQMPTQMPLMNRDDQYDRKAAVRTDFEVTRNPNEQLVDPRMPSPQSTMNGAREFAPNGNLIVGAPNVNQNAVPNQLNPVASPNVVPNGDNANALFNQAMQQNSSNQEAEVICIVRPRDSRQTQGTVVVLEHASAEFLAKLETEKAAQQLRTGNAPAQQPNTPSPYPAAPSASVPAVIPVSATSAPSANLLPTSESRHIPTGAPIAWPMR